MDFYNDRYDVVLIGGGVASLAAGISLAKEGLSVLILEQHNLPGGVVTSFLRDGYEYEASLHELMAIGSKEDPHLLRQAFEKYGIEVDWLHIPELYRLLAKEDNIDFIMPNGVENALEAIEKEVPGSKESIRLFFAWCDKVWKSAIRTSSGEKISGKEYLKDHFELIASSSYSVKQMMNHCKIPERAQKLLATYWDYLGTPLDIMPFTPWAYMLAEYFSGGAYIPKGTTSEIALKMTRKFQEFGGQIEFDQRVDKILIKQRKAYAVRLASGKTIRADIVVSNAYPNTVYTKMIEPAASVPKRALWNISSKKVAVSAFQVNLVLDKEPSFFHLNSYATFISVGPMDSRAQYESMKTKEPFLYLATTCHNFADPNALPKGKTMMTITSSPFGNTIYDIRKEEYASYKETTTRKLIEITQKELGCDMMNHLESVVSFSPATIARYTGAFNGSMYGYVHSLPDSVVARTIQKKKERYFKNLYFVGAHAPQGDGVACVIYSGYETANAILAKRRKRK